jgi:hypothetical protein
MTSLRLAAAGLVLAVLSGCASFVAPPYSTDYATLDRLKNTPLQSVAVASVQPSDAAAPVNRVTLRGAQLLSPKGTYAKYLEDALIQDLREIRVYDPQAGLRISATVLKNSIDVSGISTGEGQMEVDLAVERGTSVVLRKNYSATTRFESSFAGAVAVPKGQQEYPLLVRALLSKVYADPDFVSALKK